MTIARDKTLEFTNTRPHFSFTLDSINHGIGGPTREKIDTTDNPTKLSTEKEKMCNRKFVFFIKILL